MTHSEYSRRKPRTDVCRRQYGVRILLDAIINIREYNHQAAEKHVNFSGTHRHVHDVVKHVTEYEIQEGVYCFHGK